MWLLQSLDSGMRKIISVYPGHVMFLSLLWHVLSGWAICRRQLCGRECSFQAHGPGENCFTRRDTHSRVWHTADIYRRKGSLTTTEGAFTLPSSRPRPIKIHIVSTWFQPLVSTCRDVAWRQPMPIYNVITTQVWTHPPQRNTTHAYYARPLCRLQDTGNTNSISYRKQIANILISRVRICQDILSFFLVFFSD